VMANLAALYAEEKNYTESANFCKKALQIHDQDYIVWDTLRLAYEGLGDAANVDATAQSETKLLENTVKVKPEDGMAQAVLADLYARDKQVDKSSARIGAALSLAPNDPQVLMEIADAYANSHDRARAQVYIQKAVKKGADVAAIEDDVELKGLNLDFDKEFRGK
jgi:eukaryotic-like serine/threonine-protein kinase